MQRPALRKSNEVTKFIAARNLAVYFLHFKNHVDPICQAIFNPFSYPELAPVNSVICEQTFAWTDQHTNVKVKLYLLYFTYCFNKLYMYVYISNFFKVNPTFFSLKRKKNQLRLLTISISFCYTSWSSTVCSST